MWMQGVSNRHQNTCRGREMPIEPGEITNRRRIRPISLPIGPVATVEPQRNNGGSCDLEPLVPGDSFHV